MAALKKRWLGTAATVTTGTTAWGTATNWAPISLTKPVYKWTVSAAQANEYRLELIGGGDPGISAPGAVYINSAVAAAGTLGALTVGQYAYGDNDTLGYSTVYVRVTGSVDPDTLAIGYIQMYQVPVATDHVRIPAGSGAIAGIDLTGVALGDFVSEEGHTAAVGSFDNPLCIDPDLFEWSGVGPSYIHSIGAIAHDVRNAGTGTSGTAGLYLTTTQASILTVFKGTVGLAWLHGQAATATTVRVCGPAAKLWLGKGCTVTTAYLASGELRQHCSTTSTLCYGGQLYTEEAGTITTLTLDMTAAAVLNSTGTITTLNMQPALTGTADFLKSAEARTVTTLNQKNGTLNIDKTIVTVGTDNVGDSKPQKRTISNAA